MSTFIATDSVQTKTTRWVGGRCPQHPSRDKNKMELGHIQNDDSKEPIPRRESVKRNTGTRRPKVAPTSASAAAWRGFMRSVYQNAKASNSNWRSCSALFLGLGFVETRER